MCWDGKKFLIKDRLSSWAEIANRARHMVNHTTQVCVSQGYCANDFVLSADFFWTCKCAHGVGVAAGAHALSFIAFFGLNRGFSVAGLPMPANLNQAPMDV